MYVDGPTRSAEWLTLGNVERVDGENSTPPNEIQDRGTAGIQEAEFDPPAEMKSTVKMGVQSRGQQKVAVDRDRDQPRLRVIDLVPWLWLLLPSLDTLTLTNIPLMDRSSEGRDFPRDGLSRHVRGLSACWPMASCRFILSPIIISPRDHRMGNKFWHRTAISNASDQTPVLVIPVTSSQHLTPYRRFVKLQKQWSTMRDLRNHLANPINTPGIAPETGSVAFVPNARHRL